MDTNEDLCFSHGFDDEENGLYVEDSEYEEEKIGVDLRKRNHSGFLKSAKETRKHEVPSLPASEVWFMMLSILSTYVYKFRGMFFWITQSFSYLI